MYGCTDVQNVQDVYRGILWLHLVYSTKDASWTVLGGSFQEPVLGTPTSSYTDYILSIYFMKSIRCVFKTVYLFILNEEKGGTCGAN